MIVRISAAIGLGSLWLLYGADAPTQDGIKQRVQVSNTQRIDFPSGGTLRLKNAVGVLTVEAWDREDVEITTIKSTKGDIDPRDRQKAADKLGRVHVTAVRQGNELVVTTEYPRFHIFPPPYPIGGKMSFDLEYRIKAPANARVIDERHDAGEVNIDGLRGDIDVSLLQGEIMLHLPEDGRYHINAKTDFGSVNSDFPGPDLNSREKRRPWLLGHRNESDNPGAMHSLKLRVGFGDVVILKVRTPQAPPPVT